MSQSFNPDHLDITKQEVLDYLRIVYVRMKNNPKVARKVRAKFGADIKLIEWFETEEDLKYHLQLAMEIADGIRSIVARKKLPELQKINPMHKDAFIRALALPPEITSENDAMKIIAEAKAAMRHGGMKND